MIQKTQPFFWRALAQTIGAESIPNRGGYSKNSRYTADTFVVQPAQWSCRSSTEDIFYLNQNWNPNNNQLDHSMEFSSSSRLKNWWFRGPSFYKLHWSYPIYDQGITSCFVATYK